MGVDSKDAVRRTLDMHTDQPSDPGNDLQQSESDVKVAVTSEKESKPEITVKMEVDSDLPLQKFSEFAVEGGKDATETNADGASEKMLTGESPEVCKKLSDSGLKDVIPTIESSSHQAVGVVTGSGVDIGAGSEVSIKVS